MKGFDGIKAAREYAATRVVVPTPPETMEERVAWLTRERDEAQRFLRFAEEWYGVRWERLRALLKESHPDVWRSAVCIMANGTDHHRGYEPPTYAQQLNLAKHRAEKAEAEVERLREAGRDLACCAFNLKQRDHLSERERRSLAESQERWDCAVRGDRG